jgi:hypothetical protein
MPPKKLPPLEMDELLASEFDYIAQTANQANEDRARVSSFYLVAVGSLLAALFGTQFFDSNAISAPLEFMFSGLFLLLTLLGTSSIMQLARLRAAWYESMLAMNQIKEFMVAQNKDLDTAFRWTTRTLPPKFKLNSVSFYQAIEVALISGLMFGASVFFLQQALADSIRPFHWIISVVAGIFTLFIQLVIYKRTLK